jgi:hypothetical protein
MGTRSRMKAACGVFLLTGVALAIEISVPGYPANNPTNLDVAGRLRNATAHAHALETFAEQVRQDLWLMRMTLHARTTLLDEDIHGEGAPLRVVAERKAPLPLQCEGELQLESSRHLLGASGPELVEKWTQRALGRDIAPESLDIAQYAVHIAECVADSLDLAKDLSSSGAVAQLGCLHEELLGAATSRVTFDAQMAMSELHNTIVRVNATLRALRSQKQQHSERREDSTEKGRPSSMGTLVLPPNTMQGRVTSDVLQPLEFAIIRTFGGISKLLNVVRLLIGDEAAHPVGNQTTEPFGTNNDTHRRDVRFSSFFVECCFLERGRAATDEMASPTSIYAPQCVSHWSRQREWRHWRLALTHELRQRDSPLGQALREVLLAESASMRPATLLADIDEKFEELEARMLDRVRAAMSTSN